MRYYFARLPTERPARAREFPKKWALCCEIPRHIQLGLPFGGYSFLMEEYLAVSSTLSLRDWKNAAHIEQDKPLPIEQRYGPDHEADIL